MWDIFQQDQANFFDLELEVHQCSGKNYQKLKCAKER